MLMKNVGKKYLTSSNKGKGVISDAIFINPTRTCAYICTYTHTYTKYKLNFYYSDL
jgi:hypothetical protein